MSKHLQGEAAIQFGHDLAAAAMAGLDLPKTEHMYISAEDVRIGNGRFFRDLVKRMEKLPAKLSDDPAAQASLRDEISKTLAEAEIRIADAMFKLTGTPGRED